MMYSIDGGKTWVKGDEKGVRVRNEATVCDNAVLAETTFKDNNYVIVKVFDKEAGFDSVPLSEDIMDMDVFLKDLGLEEIF